MTKQGTPDDDSTPTKSDQTAQPKDKATTVNTKKDTRSLMPSKEDEAEDEVSYETRHYFPPSWTNFEKMSKEDAHYGQGKPFHNCGTCTYYQSSHCKVVRGYIEQSMGCKYFSKKYDSTKFSKLMRGL